MSSHDAVARVRRLVGRSRVGHAGTLDPAASGVLPIAVGRCTRLLPYLDLVPKVYQAEVGVGTMTHTGDAQGAIVARGPVRRWSPAEIARAGQWLVGNGWQIPPQVSALKSQGRRHYDTVRQGGVVWPNPRRVAVATVDGVEPTGDGWRFRTEVGSGTYVRAMVRDWGFLLGSAVHLKSLTRTRVGTFWGEAAVELDQLDEGWEAWLTSWDRHLGTARHVIDAQEAVQVAHGDLKVLDRIGVVASGVLAVVFESHLMAIVEGPPWRYRVVFGEGI